MNDLPKDIHALAKLMVAEGFVGQGMQNEEKAGTYICAAADDPDVEAELPPRGFEFWKFARLSFKFWRARKKLDEVYAKLA